MQHESRTAAILWLCAASFIACSDGDGDEDVGRTTERDSGFADVLEDTLEDDVALADSSSDGGGLDDAEQGDTGSSDDATSEDVPVFAPEVIVVPGAETLPDRFADAAPSDTAGPDLLYPADNTMMPRNAVPPVIQWSGPAGGQYRLRAATTSRVHDVYTTDWKWQADPDVWARWVSEAQAGELVVSVASLATDGTIQESSEIRLRFSATAIGGAVYYWAPSAGGIVRLPVGEPEPEPFLTPGTLPCVGCHALSPDGSRLAYTQTSAIPSAGTLGVIGTGEAEQEYIRPSAGLSVFYPSFAPDNVHLAGAQGEDIVIVNTDTGQLTDRIDVDSVTATATYPSWSPRGDELVFSLGGAGGAVTNGVSGAGIARSRLRDGDWSDPTWLLESGDVRSAGENLFYPAFSPDSRWLVFNRANGPVAAGGAPAGTDLWIIPSYGGDAVRLDTANGDEGTNSWPKWAPTSADGTLWVAFTSDRSYGRLGGGTDQWQIWIAGIRPGAAPGEDPSYAAYWMPGQLVTDSNHVAYWAAYEKD